MKPVISPLAPPTQEQLDRLNANGLAIRADMDRRHAENAAAWIRQRDLPYGQCVMGAPFACGHDIGRAVHAFCAVAGRVAVHHYVCVACEETP